MTIVTTAIPQKPWPPTVEDFLEIYRVRIENDPDLTPEERSLRQVALLAGFRTGRWDRLLGRACKRCGTSPLASQPSRYRPKETDRPQCIFWCPVCDMKSHHEELFPLRPFRGPG